MSCEFLFPKLKKKTETSTSNALHMEMIIAPKINYDRIFKSSLTMLVLHLKCACEQSLSACECTLTRLALCCIVKLWIEFSVDHFC